MCYAEIREYTGCKHKFGYRILQPCLLGLTPTGYCVANSLEMKYIAPCSEPPLCPSCYRKVETEIFDFHDKIIADIRAGREIQPITIRGHSEEELRQRARNAGNWERRERVIEDLGLLDVAGGQREWTEEDERLVRKTVVADFREYMGVWGDG